MTNKAEDMKFCKDCKFGVENNIGKLGCNNPEVSKYRSPVTGKVPLLDCWYARVAYSKLCGPEAKYFEPKEVVIPWYKKLFRRE